MPVQMTHATFGTRTVQDRQVSSYERTGWKSGAEVVPAEVDATREQVLADVGEDPEKAREAIAAEQARSKPRSTLVAALLRVIESDPAQEA